MFITKKISDLFYEVKNILYPEKIEPSAFDTIAKTVKKSDSSYHDTREMALLCKDGMKIAAQRIELVKKQAELTSRKQDLENFEKLDENQLQELKNLLEKHQGAFREKTNLRNQLSSFDKKVHFLKNFEQEVPLIIEEIDNAENRQRMFKHDISYLEGEKSQLLYEREQLQFGIRFNYIFSVVTVIVCAVAAVVLAALFIFYRKPVFFPASILAIASIILGSILIITRRRLIFELQKNELMQQKAVKMLNKKRIHFAHHTNFLDYEYKKYKVKNATALKNNWKEYSFLKNITLRHERIKQIVYELEVDLERFLVANKINSSKVTIDKISQIIDIDNKKLMHRQIETETQQLENQLSILDTQQENIWAQITEIKSRYEKPPFDENGEKIDEHIIVGMVHKFMNDVDELANAEKSS